MCNACVIESVKETMLSRRKLFLGAAATGAAAVAAGAMGARPAMAEARGKIVDMTYVFDEAFPTFDGIPGIAYEEAVNFDKSGYQLWKISFFEHSGTHIDAPLHFSKDGTSVAELAPESLICPLCVIDITAKARDDANAMLEAADVEAWITANGAIAPGSCVAINSGWGAKMGTPEFRNTPDGSLTFPGFGKSATDLLATMDVAAIASDTMSLDPGNSPDFAVHKSWLPGGRYGIENLANVDQMPAKGATIFVGAPKHARGTGGPARILAMI